MGITQVFFSFFTGMDNRCGFEQALCDALDHNLWLTNIKMGTRYGLPSSFVAHLDQVMERNKVGFVACIIFCSLHLILQKSVITMEKCSCSNSRHCYCNVASQSLCICIIVDNQLASLS